MPAPYLGGLRITAAAWLGPATLRVAYASEWAGLCHQLYAGRRLVGVSASTTARAIAAPFAAGAAPEHLAIAAVAPADRLVDFGPRLPRRPYARVRLAFEASGFPADAKFLDVTAGTAAGGAVDPANLIARELYDADGAYEVLTEPMPGSGAWNFEVRGRDGRPPDGNLGDPLALSAAVLVYPPDVALRPDGTRLDAAAAAGTLTVTCEL